MRKMDFKKFLVAPALLAATVGTVGCSQIPTTKSPARGEWAPEVSMLSWAGVKAQSREEAKATLMDEISNYSIQGYRCGTRQNPCKGQAGGSVVGQKKSRRYNVLSVNQPDLAVSWGDPYFSTYDMTQYFGYYNTQLGNNQLGHVVQARNVRFNSMYDPYIYEVRSRQQKMSNGWVINKAASLRAGNHSVFLDFSAPAGLQFRIDNTARALPDPGQQIIVADAIFGTINILRSPSGSVLHISYKAPNKNTVDVLHLQMWGVPEVGIGLNLALAPGSDRRGTLMGALGSTDLDSMNSPETVINDFKLPNGQEVPVADLDGNGAITPDEIIRFNAFLGGNSDALPYDQKLRLRSKIDTFTASWMAGEL